MKRKCIVCGRVYGESGDKQNGSVSGGICDACMLAIEEYRYYKRMYQATGFVEYERLMTATLQGLHKRERANRVK
jgi:hypothetical protein